MSVSIATWNINSVRLRLGLVLDFLKRYGPDVLMLQEIKCTNDQFPALEFAAAGYPHQAVHGQKGYHGVATISRFPLTDISSRVFVEIPDSRHVSAQLDFGRGPLTVHNFYIPAGGDEPDPEINPKFGHKLSFLDEMRDHEGLRPAAKQRAILVGDLNVAPLEHDVWSHKQMLKVVSHAPVECEKLNAARSAGNWVDTMRVLTPEPEKLYTWWSYRAMDNWRAADRGRRLDHVWTSDAIAGEVSKIAVAKDYRGAERPSDHVPVTARVEV